MKNLTVLALIVMLSTVSIPDTFASDWDIAGKVLTGIEGLRIITGGNVDLIGSITGINSKRHPPQKTRRQHRYKHHEYCRRQWVPDHVWKKEWIPAHTEYSKKYGEIVVEGHFIKYKVTRGGHWLYTCNYE